MAETRGRRRDVGNAGLAAQGQWQPQGTPACIVH